MYQLDEKLMSDTRAIIALSRDKSTIEPQLKPGMLNYVHNSKDMYIVTGEGQYRRLLQETEEGKIPGDVHFEGNVTIDKNLIVKGDATEIITEQLSIEDNIITLNKGEKGAVITEGESGILIDRGIEQGTPSALLLFKEQSDRSNTQCFTLGIEEDTFLTAYSDGDLVLKKDLHSTKGIFTDALSTEKGLTVAENIECGQNLSVEGALTLKGNAHLQSDLTVDGATTLQTLNTLNNIIADGEQNVFSGSVDVLKSHYVGEDLEVNQNATIQNNLTVNGNTLLKNLTADDITAAQVITEALAVEALNVNGDCTFQKALTVKGLTTLNGLIAQNTTLESLTVNKRVIFNEHAITQTMQVNGDMVAGAHLSVEDDLTVYGLTTLNTTNVQDILTVENNIVTKTSFVGSDLVLSHNGDVGNDLIVRGNLIVNGALDLKDNLKISNLHIKQDFVVDGNSTFNGVVTVNNALMSNDLIVNNSITTPEISSDKYYLGSNKNNVMMETEENGLFDQLSNNVTFDLNNTNFLIKQDDAATFHVTKNAIRFKGKLERKVGEAWAEILDNKTSHSAMHRKDGIDPITPNDIGAVANGGNVPSIQSGEEERRPIAGNLGRLFVAQDARKIYFDNGATWDSLTATEWGSIENIPETFTPPIATTETLGGVIVGKGLEITEEGVLSLYEPDQELIVNRQEFIATDQQTIFELDTPYELQSNAVSVYVFGRHLPSSAFIERTQNMIELREGVDEGTHVEVVTTLIPVKNHSICLREEMFVQEGQTEFQLRRGSYKMNNNSLRIFVQGQFLPPSAFEEINETTFRLKQAPQKDDLLVVEYINHAIHNEALKIEESKQNPQRIVHCQIEPSTTWRVVHGLKKYPSMLVIDERGIKIEPTKVQYVTQNRAILTFDTPLKGKVFV